MCQTLHTQQTCLDGVRLHTYSESDRACMHVIKKKRSIGSGLLLEALQAHLYV